MGAHTHGTVLRRIGITGTLLSALVVMSSWSPVTGSGCPTAVAPTSVGGVYEIDSAAKLQWAKDNGSMSHNYKLTGNVDMTGCTWSRGIGDPSNSYTGTFNGNGKTISNLTINGVWAQRLGLISDLSGSISNLTLASPSVTGLGNYVGALAGYLRANSSVTNVTLTSVSVSGGQQSGGAIGFVASGATVTTLTISGTFSAPSGLGGGAFGQVEGTTSGVTSSVSVSGANSIGGIVGNLNPGGSISDSTATGNVSGGSSGSNVGGIAGNASGSGSITNTSATGNVTGSSSLGGAVGFAAGTRPVCATLTGVTASGQVSGWGYMGGLIGEGNCYKVIRSSSSSTVTATGPYVGGLVGFDNYAGSIEKSFFTGQVQGTELVGGIGGLMKSVITDSYSSGSVTATSASNGGRAGGLVGRLDSSGVSGDPPAEITRSLARGLVTPPSGGSSTVGGLVGERWGGTITASVWDTQATGRSTSQGTGAKGYTTQQLRDYVLYDADNLNWDITDGISTGNGVSSGTVWSVCSGVNSGYPFLTFQGLSGTCRPTMAYNGNGNSSGTAPSDGSTPYTSGDTVTVLGNTGSLAKTSNVFSGWNTKADGTGTPYAAGETFDITNPTMLFAVWTSTPIVAYRANGGTGTVSNTTGASGSTITLSSGSGFTRTNYLLSRWDTSVDGTGTSYSKTQSISMPASGLTLYAIWTPLPSVTYNANGGTGSITSTFATSGTSVTLSNGSGFTRSGYILSRWDTSSSGNGTSYSKSQSVSMPANGLALYAVWIPDPSITTTTTSTIAPTTTTTVAGATTTTVPASNGVANPAANLPSGLPTTARPGGVNTPAKIASTAPVAATPTTSAVTTTSVAPAPEAKAPDIESVTSGDLAVTVGGKPAKVDIREENGSLVATVGDGRITLTMTGSDGLPRRLAPGTVRSMSYGDRVKVDLAGFATDSEATAWVTPDGVALGQTTLVGGAGTVEGVISESVTPGQRRITVATESSEGEPIVVAYGVQMIESDSAGATWSRVLFVILGLAIVAALLIPAARRRRRNEE